MRETDSDPASLEGAWRYRELFENSGDGICLIDVTPDGRFLCREINPAGEKLIGLTGEQLAGSLIEESSAGLLGETAVASFRRCVASRDIVHFNEILDSSAGGREIAVTLTPVRNSEGKVSRIASVMREVTRPSHREGRLALLDFALNRMRDATFLIDDQARFHYVNDESCRALGYTREELLGLRVGDIDPDWPQTRWSEHWSMLREAGSLLFEGRHRTRDGRIFPVEISANYFEFGGQTYNLALVRDISERRAGETLLHAREQEFRALAENAPDPIVRYDRECRRLYVNPAVLRLSGKTPEELLGNAPDDSRLVASAEAAKLLRCIRQVVATGQPVEDDVEFVDPNGERRYFHNRFVPEWATDGTVATVLSVSSDITELKRSEQRLKMLDLALEHVREPAFIIDRETMRLLYVNNEVCLALGYPRDELLTMTVFDIDPDYTPEIMAIISRQADIAGTVTMERRHRRRDGSIFPVEICTSVFEYDGIHASIALSRDISERKKMETALRESERKFRSLVENWPDEIARYDASCRRIYVNPMMEKTLGPSPQLVGQTPTETYPGTEEVASYEARLREVLTTGVTVEFEMGWGTPATQPRYRLVRLVAERDEEGNIRGVLAIARDITERKRVEEKLVLLNETLEQRVHEELAKNREKDLLLIQQSRLAAMGEMVHNIAHQWRQPISALGILLANIKDSYEYGELTPESMAQLVENGTRIVHRMSTTIDDFRDFFRPDKEKSDFPIARCLREVEGVLGAALAQHGIELSDRIEGDIIAHGMTNEFAQVLLNVVNNAKEAIIARRAPRGRISVQAETRGDMVEVRVTDNGGGIPEDVLPKIFDPYFTTKEKGTGIGLYMSKMIVAGNMGGEISARNTDDGAEMLIRIPAANQPG